MKQDYRYIYYLYMYFDILKEANKNYRILLNLYGSNNRRKIEELYYKIAEYITQVVPYKVYKGLILLKENNGILELLNGNMPFVKIGLRKILDKYEKEMISIKYIRNNIEHSPHRLFMCSQLSSKGSSNIYLKYYKNGVDTEIINIDDLLCCECSTDNLKKVLFEINELYKDIRKEIKRYYIEGKINEEVYALYKKYRLKVD